MTESNLIKKRREHQRNNFPYRITDNNDYPWCGCHSMEAAEKAKKIIDIYINAWNYDPYFKHFPGTTITRIVKNEQEENNDD